MKHSNSQSSFYLRAKKSLGQNFLKDPTVVENIVLAANDFLKEKSKDNAKILEIGPGTGLLTKPLLQNPNRPNDTILTIEKDARAIAGLQKTLLQEFPNHLQVIETDILKYTPQSFDLCIGNIPYYITSDILMWLCQYKHQFLGAIFMVQDEVANRLAAKINTKEYSRLTVKMQLNFTIEKLFKVPKECFVPQPKVNSAVIRLIPNSFKFNSQIEEKQFEQFTTLLFSQRRKMLRRILASHFKNLSAERENEFWKKVSQLNIEPTDRPESISPTNFVNFYNVFKKV